MSKEPFKVTVKDELELNIQKYEKLSAVIEQKKKNIEEVIDYGTQVLSRTYYLNLNAKVQKKIFFNHCLISFLAGMLTLS